MSILFIYLLTFKISSGRVCAYGSQRTTFESQICSSIMWVAGSELRLSGKHLYWLRHLIGLICLVLRQGLCNPGHLNSQSSLTYVRLQMCSTMSGNSFTLAPSTKL